MQLYLDARLTEPLTLPVIRLMNSTSSGMYGAPSVRKTSWNQIDGSRST
jgi:hypothetical protein